MSINPTKNPPKKPKLFEPGTTIEYRPDDKKHYYSWYQATVLDIISLNPNPKFCYYISIKTFPEKKSPNEIRIEPDNVRPVQPFEKLTEHFKLNDIVEAFHLDGRWVGKITKICTKHKIFENRVYEVTFNNPLKSERFLGAKLRLHYDWIDGKWVKPQQVEKNLKKDKSRRAQILGENSGTQNGLSPLSSDGKTLALSDPTGMKFPKRRRTQNAKSSSGNVVKNVINLAGEEGPKEAYNITKVGVAAGNHRSPSSSSSSSDGQYLSSLIAGVRHNRTVQNLTDSITAKGSGFGKQAVSSVAVVEGNGSEVIIPNNEFKTLEKSAAVEQNGGKNIDPDNQYLEIPDLNTAVETDNIDHNNEKGEMEGEVSAFEGNASNPNDQTLPFVKTFSLWKQIESMEVFKAIPQRPHFQKLVNDCPENFREGMAIGYMVNFVTVAKQATELRFDDPKRAVDGCLETLVNLEKNGFDVKVIRDRLKSFLRKKEKHDLFLNLLKENENRIMEDSCEREKVVEEIGELNKQLKEIQEKRDLALSMRETVENEIMCLELKLKSAHEEIKNLSAFNLSLMKKSG